MVMLRCDEPDCTARHASTGQDATEARREARRDGWIMGRLPGRGRFTDWCPTHAGSYLLRKVNAAQNLSTT